MGICMFVYEALQPDASSTNPTITLSFTLSFYEAFRPDALSIYPTISLSFYVISVSLNVLLTLMIVTRLILQKRNIQNAMGTAHGSGGLYNTIVTMLVESCAISALTYILYIVMWVTGNSTEMMFCPLLTVAVDERRHLRECWFDALHESRGIDGWWWDRSRRESHEFGEREWGDSQWRTHWCREHPFE